MRGRAATPFPATPPRPHPIGDGSDATTYTYGADLFDDMLAAIDAAQDRILLETYIIKGDAMGRALQAGADPTRPTAASTSTSSTTRSPTSSCGPASCVPARRSTCCATRSIRPAGRSSAPAARPRPPQDPRRRQDRRLRRRLQHRRAVRDRVARHPPQDRRPVGVGPRQRVRRLLEPARRHHRHGRSSSSGEASWEPQVRAHRNVPRQLMFPIRGMYLEAIDRAKDHIYITAAYFIPDRDILQGSSRPRSAASTSAS